MVRAGFIPRESGHLDSALELEDRSAKKLSSSAKKGKETSMKIRPLQDRVIVKRIAEEEKTKGGIIIPDTAKEKPQEGRSSRSAREGQRRRQAHRARRQGRRQDPVRQVLRQRIKLNGEEHLIMREDDILGVIEG
jgi:chaperonin GroES